MEGTQRGLSCSILPAWLKADYDIALSRASAVALADMSAQTNAETTRIILSVLALAKGELKLGAMRSGLDSSELDDWLEERLGWSELYED